MTERDEDALWRSIVENYGDRAHLDDVPGPVAESPPQAQPEIAKPTDDAPGAFVEEVTDPEPAELSWSDEEPRFVPPTPPPLPSTTRPRRVAWFGVIGAPILFLLTAFSGGTLGGSTTLTLIAVFVCSLGYLVFSMSQEPRDPWDNGARV